MKQLSPTGYYHTWRMGAKYLPEFPQIEPVESQDDPPPGWEEGFEHYRHYMMCRCCHEWKHEDNLIMTSSGGFICRDCYNDIDKLLNQII